MHITGVRICTHGHLRREHLGVQTLETSMFDEHFLYVHHTELTKIEPKINWLCALGNLETWIEYFLYGHGL